MRAIGEGGEILEGKWLVRNGVVDDDRPIVDVEEASVTARATMRNCVRVERHAIERALAAWTRHLLARRIRQERRAASTFFVAGRDA